MKFAHMRQVSPRPGEPVTERFDLIWRELAEEDLLRSILLFGAAVITALRQFDLTRDY